MGVPKNFKGKPGRSGRKSAYEEHNKTQAINTLWEKVNKKIQENEELTEYEQKLVLSVLPKTIKTETDITSGGKPTPILYATVQDNNSNQEDTETKEEN